MNDGRWKLTPPNPIDGVVIWWESSFTLPGPSCGKAQAYTVVTNIMRLLPDRLLGLNSLYYLPYPNLTLKRSPSSKAKTKDRNSISIGSDLLFLYYKLEKSELYVVLHWVALLYYFYMTVNQWSQRTRKMMMTGNVFLFTLDTLAQAMIIF